MEVLAKYEAEYPFGWKTVRMRHLLRFGKIQIYASQKEKNDEKPSVPYEQSRKEKRGKKRLKKE